MKLKHRRNDLLATERQIEILRRVGYRGPANISVGIARATYAYLRAQNPKTRPEGSEP